MTIVLENTLPKQISAKDRDLVRTVFSEFFAAFTFISVILAVSINNARSTSASLIGFINPGIAIGFAGVAVVLAFGDISGAHFNPSITLAFILFGKIPIVKGISYIFAQFVGGFAAAGIMYGIFPNTVPGFPTINEIIPVTVPSGVDTYLAMFMEVYLVYMLVYVVFAVAVDRTDPVGFLQIRPPISKAEVDQVLPEAGLSSGPPAPIVEATAKSKGSDMEAGLSAPAPGAAKIIDKPATTRTTSSTTGTPEERRQKEIREEAEQMILKRRIDVYAQPGANKKNFAAIAIGFTLGYNAYLGSTSSGGAYNLARVLGPAVLSGNWSDNWVYWVGDICGGVLGGLVHTVLFARRGALLSPPRPVEHHEDAKKNERENQRALENGTNVQNK